MVLKEIQNECNYKAEHFVNLTGFGVKNSKSVNVMQRYRYSPNKRLKFVHTQRAHDVRSTLMRRHDVDLTSF